MAIVVEWLLIIVATSFFICSLLILVEVATANFVGPEASNLPIPISGTRAAVVVPAHNEGTGLISTLQDVRAQLQSGDRLVVVADNCCDDTAAVAARAGAEVIERNDLARKGKGYALDWGLRHLDTDPPDVVLIIDADCRLRDNALAQLIQICANTGRPVQALYLMTAPDQTSNISFKISEFAWRIKNVVRPTGLASIGLPCQLMGTGMAFPWRVIRSVELASGEIVEDLKLGLDLAAAGSPPLFCSSAIVTSQFPETTAAAQSQRQRWEHGHIGLIRMVPGLLWSAIRRRNLDLFVLALDLAVPPLFLLGLLLTAMAAISGVFALFATTFTPLAISAAGVALYAIAIGLAWRKCGRDLLNSSTLPLLGPYISSKLRSYSRLVTRGAVSEWVRTDRTKID